MDEIGIRLLIATVVFGFAAIVLAVCEHTPVRKIFDFLYDYIVGDDEP